MSNWIDTVIAFFTVRDQTTIIVIWAFLGVALLCLVLRIIICLGYQTQLAILSFNAKDLISKEDVKNLKAGLIGKVVKAYVKSCEKGISSIDTRAITDKEFYKLGFLFWKYESMAGFVRGFEASIALLGLLLAFALEYTQVLVVLSVSMFIVMRIMAAFFDFELAGRRLRDEVIEYVNREIGQFYVMDLSSSISRLKIEMIESAANQSAVLDSSIQKLGADLVGVLKLAVGDMSKSVEETIRIITGYSDVLQKPMEDWRSTLTMASAVQDRINNAAGSMERAVAMLESVSGNLVNGFSEHNISAAKENQIISERSTALIKATESMSESNRHIGTHSEALRSMLEYIEKNQILLQESVNRFELTMEGLVSRLGGGMASIMEYTMQESYKVLNENLNDNIRRIMQSNNEFIHKLQKVFDTFLEQSHGEARAIAQLTEQMDMHFENIAGKLQ